jgi:hypothetical protein
MGIFPLRYVPLKLLTVLPALLHHHPKQQFFVVLFVQSEPLKFFAQPPKSISVKSEAQQSTLNSLHKHNHKRIEH